MEYRRTAERLSSELRRYRAGGRPYDGVDRLCELVDRVEATLDEGMAQWASRAAKVDSRSAEGP
jgi:hypothetical protein